MIDEPPPTDTSESGANTSASVTSVFSSTAMRGIPRRGEEVGERDAHRSQHQDGRDHRNVQHADEDEHRCYHGRVAGITPRPQLRLRPYAEKISAGGEPHRDEEPDRRGGGAFEH